MQCNVTNITIFFNFSLFVNLVNKSTYTSDNFHVILFQVPVNFEFMPKPGETSYSKPWLVAEPSSALIMPGEKCDVNFQVAYKLKDKEEGFT